MMSLMYSSSERSTHGWFNLSTEQPRCRQLKYLVPRRLVSSTLSGPLSIIFETKMEKYELPNESHRARKDRLYF